jgi:hypothetical protein
VSRNHGGIDAGFTGHVFEKAGNLSWFERHWGVFDTRQATRSAESEHWPADGARYPNAAQPTISESIGILPTVMTLVNISRIIVKSYRIGHSRIMRSV